MNFEKKRSPKYCDFGRAFSSKCFIPRREMHSISSGGPIVFTYVLFWVRKWTLKKKFTQVMWFRPSFFLQMFYLMGRVGRVGRGTKESFNFFHLRYIKDYTYIYINIYIKNVLTNFWWVLNFGQVRGPDTKFKNTL